MAENIIAKSPIDQLGYGFIKEKYLPKGKNEYYLRNSQNNNPIAAYRQLSAFEIEVLVRNGNTSDNWNHLLVSDSFNSELVKNCNFFGLVRIGKLEPFCLEFSNLKLPVGLYNSTIISSDFGDNVVINNVNYLSHYIIGNEVMIVNVNELCTTNNAKFGNGILKEDDEERVRIKIELCNENGGRAIIPFNGMLPGDAFLWSKYRDDQELMKQFLDFTEKRFDKKRGYYGMIGNRTVIKNCKIIKDVLVGTDAYFKGANKIKNVTVNSGQGTKTQIGEGCELVNGIVGYGCRIFYGVKAVRFIMGSNSQLKYGARLLNSYLGDNSTISCCEVLNSLIFPAHEQHHNNSFLCAARIDGQSNIAAGATIGSNHNSRSADGEIIAGRGFWPGLCVSLKHNSKFASFTILSKGDYPSELNITIPFSLVSNDASKDRLIVMPAYWFLYNTYALVRNSTKYDVRDKRINKTQFLEYDYLAPDTIQEIYHSLTILKKYVGQSFFKNSKKSEKENIDKGYELLESKEEINFEILATDFENSKRDVVLIKVQESYNVFKELIQYYLGKQLLNFINTHSISSVQQLKKAIPSKNKYSNWINIGGQLIEEDEIVDLKNKIKKHKVKSWTQVHLFYQNQASHYPQNKLNHAILIFEKLNGLSLKNYIKADFINLFNETFKTQEWINELIYTSREKDYSNSYRKMVYDTQKELNEVIGSLNKNAFIIQQKQELEQLRKSINNLKKNLK